MNKLKQLKYQLRKVVSANPVYPVMGVVKSIQGDTCTVEVGGLELSGVRLKATADGSQNFVLIPAINSNVMMISLDGSIDNLTIVKMDKVAKILFEENGLKLDFDSETGKLGLKNNSTSLHQLFSDLTNLLNGFTLNHPQGPTTGLMPSTMAAVQQFQTSFNQLLKNI